MKLHDKDIDISLLTKWEIVHGNNSPSKATLFLSDGSEQEISVYLDSEKEAFREEFDALTNAAIEYQQQIRDSQKAP